MVLLPADRADQRMERLRFLMISTHFPPQHLGGDAVFVEYLSKELVDRGHEVHVLHSPSSYRLLRESDTKVLPEKEDPGVIRHTYSPSTGRLNPLLALTLGCWRGAERRTNDLVRNLKPDVVHWHNTKGFIGRPFAVKNAVCLYTAHDYTTVCPRSNLLKPNMAVCDVPHLCTICHLRWGKPPQLWRAGEGRRVVRLPEDIKVLSLSEFVANRLNRDGIKVHRVLRGFVPDLAEGVRTDSRSESIVYMGLIERHKGVQLLLDAFSNTRNSQQFELFMIGEGTYKDAIKRHVRQLKLSGRVHVTGFLPRKEAEAIRKNSAVQVVPSVWYENAPSTILEAYSLGLPVLASDIGGLPEIVGPDSGSATFNPGDVDRLGELLVEIWNSRMTLDERRRKARNAYEGKFRPEIHVSQYLKAISEFSR
jgi:glycosyltransferase involved in cell wall biosynthesis